MFVMSVGWWDEGREFMNFLKANECPSLGITKRSSVYVLTDSRMNLRDVLSENPFFWLSPSYTHSALTPKYFPSVAHCQTSQLKTNEHEDSGAMCVLTLYGKIAQELVWEMKKFKSFTKNTYMGWWSNEGLINTSRFIGSSASDVCVGSPCTLKRLLCDCEGLLMIQH